MTGKGTRSNTRPIHPHTGRPLPPSAQPGYYPGFSTLSQQAFWDEATRSVVLGRVSSPPALCFFTPDEIPIIQAVLDRIIPQDDRDDEHRVPVLNPIDERLWTGRIDGYRYVDMPPDGEAYRLGLQGIEAIADHMYGKSFVDLEPLEQDAVLWTLHEGEPEGGEDIWQRVPVNHFWIMLVSDAVDAYYSHPYAWDEIGFGGPAYPRGYFRLEKGQPEPWEVAERRYDWSPPPTSSSGSYKALGGKHPSLAPAGQEGTH